MTMKKSNKNPVTVRGPWFPCGLEVLQSRAFAQLSPHASKLFLDLCSQLGPNCRRNGDLSAAWSVMAARGWSSKSKLADTLAELIDAKFIIVTRQGGRRMCSLYALTPWPLDCDLSKLDVRPGCYTTHDWTQGQKELQEPPKEESPVKWRKASSFHSDPGKRDRLAKLETRNNKSRAPTFRVIKKVMS